jgi:glycosyltransferase involved in cell wall biosynthesis
MNSTTDHNKGFHLLQPALRKLAAGRGNGKETEVIIFGASEPAEPPDFGMKTRFMGRLHDDVSLALLYSAADIFVAPSIQENLANTVVEAMACATPCIAFNIGGMPDMIDHMKNGYLARPYEPEDLAHGISWILGDENRIKRLSTAAREKAVNEFSMELMTRRYRELYADIIADY